MIACQIHLLPKLDSFGLLCNYMMSQGGLRAAQVRVGACLGTCLLMNQPLTGVFQRLVSNVTQQGRQDHTEAVGQPKVRVHHKVMQYLRCKCRKGAQG